MRTSPNVNIFHFSGPLSGESTGEDLRRHRTNYGATVMYHNPTGNETAIFYITKSIYKRKYIFL